MLGGSKSQEVLSVTWEEPLHPGQSWTTREQPDLSAHPTEKGNGGQSWDSANPSWTALGLRRVRGVGLLGRPGGRRALG